MCKKADANHLDIIIMILNIIIVILKILDINYYYYLKIDAQEDGCGRGLPRGVRQGACFLLIRFYSFYVTIYLLFPEVRQGAFLLFIHSYCFIF